VKCGDTITQEMIGDGSVGAGTWGGGTFLSDDRADGARRLLGSFDDPTVRFLKPRVAICARSSSQGS
jgi:hypothetical protein